MPRPVKIKKAKSFMFTTKHHSFSGVMGCILCVISITVLVGGIYLAFVNKGKSDLMIGGCAFFALILNILGIISGLTSLSERDIHRWVPYTSIVANSVVLALWVLLVIRGA